MKKNKKNLSKKQKNILFSRYLNSKFLIKNFTPLELVQIINCINGARNEIFKTSLLISKEKNGWVTTESLFPIQSHR